VVIGKEAADLFIMNHAAKGDIAVTKDIGLASTLLPKGVYVLSPRGTLFEEKGILTALDMRFSSAKACRSESVEKGQNPYYLPTGNGL
jgi:uncharacterized protein YaiI (UPF0178 family)